MPNSRKTLAEFEKSAETGVETSFKNSVTGKTARVSAGKRLEKKSPLIALVRSLIICGGLIFA
ncbi:hypothetical protein IJG10_01705, partial [Candidatus Saccharibacteria bacterium]|nr:hypothetical protein [Candidatus Saccharibacteria bacterium]